MGQEVVGDAMEYEINKITSLVFNRRQGLSKNIMVLVNDHLHILDFLIKGKFRRAFNLLYTLYFVPCGEGSKQILYKLGLAKLFTRYPKLVPVPRYVEIEITTVCDKYCIFCEHTFWKKEDQEIRHLTFDEFKFIVEQFPAIRWVNLTGEGSAFLNKDYFEMIRYLREKYDTAIYLVDHLSDVNKEELTQLINLVDGIYVSIDGATKQTYERIQKGCIFENVIENIKYIIRRKRMLKQYKPDLHFRYVLIKDNIEEVPLFIDLINSLGTKKDLAVSTIGFTGLLYFDGIREMYLDRIPEHIVNELVLRRSKGIVFNFEHPLEETKPPLSQCLAWMEPYIMMGGYVLPCCSVLMSNNRPFLRKNAFGNVFEEPFIKIWNSERYKRFRKMVVDEHIEVPLLCVGCRGFDTRERERLYGIAKDI